MTNSTPLQIIEEDDLALDYKPKYRVFHDLMTKRINKVLLVSSYYDNFILEEDGRLSDQIFEEFHNLNLRTLPSITRVASAKEALKLVEEKEFDLVITMRRLGDVDAFAFGQNIKKVRDIPVILLLNNASIIPYLPDLSKRQGIDRIFLWNGDSTVFVAIIKHLEDKLNVAHDTEVGLVRVIIVVEDSIRHYSLFLPLIYSELMKQTHRLISAGINDFYNLLQMRARPKILLACTYEEALGYYQKYKKYVIGVISDVRFPREGIVDDEAGIKFIKEVKSNNLTLPTALHSRQLKNKQRANELGAFFIYKKSRRLLQNLREFMLRHLGFGDFIFRLADGSIVGRARNIMELFQVISVVPDESLVYHGSHDHFSGWLMNRAEFAIAQKIKPVKVTDFTVEKLRQFLLESINAILIEKSGGVVHDWDRDSHHPAIRFTRLRPGSLGGKGRGIAFLQFLLNTFLLADEIAQDVDIRIPKTFVIGTSEFDHFMEKNEDLYNIALSDVPDEEIKTSFLKAKISKSLMNDLRFILESLTGPLSVRSSSLLEDSQYQPFAGIFETYFLPNNQDMDIRVELLCDAIKLVYASSFLKKAKSYAESTDQSVEESKMAVVIQQVVGREHPNRLSYPSFSGVASSYNYYPISYMKPADRIAFLAVGLGKTIVDGGIALRFCPKYPEISFYSTHDQLLQNSQRDFFAIDLASTATDISEGENSFLIKASVFDADKKILSEVADTYDYNDQVLRNGYMGEGAPIITFSNQLKYKTFPIAQTISRILELGEKAMGCSVEIEFAGNFQLIPKKRTTFYLLQIRPFIEQNELLSEETVLASKSEMLAYSSQISGNRIIKDIQDIVYIKPESFDKLKTREMVSEVDKINQNLQNQRIPYILLGIGRWGTFEQFLGIPVKWNHISGAQVIIETGLENFQVEHSQGSHFFQNITSANIGYFFIKYKSKKDFIDWHWLKSCQNIITETDFVRHIRVKSPFLVIIDGRKREGMIIKPGWEHEIQ
ncbi:MAG: PEP/pyruvate-binding domain-containing protein [Candidatus Thorarchaeota archaeon]